MSQSIVQIDAFTDTPFRGNPAALCLLDSPREEAWMQAVAAEMNLSETAYLVPEGDGYRLRWFTPACEVRLCGHATVAAAHLLWHDGHVPQNTPCVFHTLSGELVANTNGDWIEVSFPAKRPQQGNPPSGLAVALGATPTHYGQNELNYGLVVLDSEQAVRNLQPDFTALKKLPPMGYAVTARSNDEPYAFVSRFFAPNAGVDEDPVTGSAHCMLAPYWSEQLGRAGLLAYQASARGGVVRARVEGDRVILGGQAVIVMRGELVS